MLIGIAASLVVAAVRGARGTTERPNAFGIRLPFWPVTLVVLAARSTRA